MPGTAPVGEDLIAQLPERTARMLSANVHADRCVFRAVAWLRARLLRNGIGDPVGTPDWDNEIQREAVLKRAEYELWSTNEREDVASDKKEDANDLLEGLIGSGYDGGAGEDGGGAAPARTVGAAVHQSTRSALSRRYAPDAPPC